MTLYDEVCKIEEAINARRNAVNTMPCRMGEGVSFDDEYDMDALKKAEVERLLENPEYAGNPVVQRMKKGESLVGILDEILTQKPYGLRFRWKRRKEFNRQTEFFKDIVKDGLWMKQHYFLDPACGAEGAAFYPSCLGYLVGSALTLAGQEPLGFVEHFNNPDALNVGGAIIFGGLFFLYGLMMEKMHSKYIPRICEECGHINKALGMREGIINQPTLQ